MRKKRDFLNGGLRPAAALFLCTCLAFSAVSSYVPRISYSEASAKPQGSGGDALGEALVLSTEELLEGLEETVSEETEAEEKEFVPAPYLLNFAYQYPENSEMSYAETLMRELIQKDSQWYAEIYDMANIAPTAMAARLGRPASSVMGKYNPASKKQKANDPSTWAVDHFKNVRVSFYNGDGEITSAVSNAQDILSMASVYAYHNGITDMGEIRSYMNHLWSASHSYAVSMGDLYYCDGCVSVDQSAAEEEIEDEELSGEDTFAADRTIDTEITVKETTAAAEGETVSAESNGESLSGETSLGDLSRLEPSVPGSSKEGEHESSKTAVIVPGESTPASSAGSSGAGAFPSAPSKEETTSPLDSVAETAESVYVEETEKPKVVIVPVTEPSEEETTKFIWNPETEGSKVLRDETETATEPQTAAVPETTASLELEAVPAVKGAGELAPASERLVIPASEPSMPKAPRDTAEADTADIDIADAADTAEGERKAALRPVDADVLLGAEEGKEGGYFIEMAALSMDGEGQAARPVETTAAPATKAPAETVPVIRPAAPEQPTAPAAPAKTKAPAETKAPTETKAQETSTSAAPQETKPAETSQGQQSTSQSAEGQPSENQPQEPKDTKASETGSSLKVCPGHVDLKITAKIYTLSDENSLYGLDQIGSQAKEGGEWQGWNDKMKGFVNHINRQDWVAEYDLNITVANTSAPLSDTEIESYMKILPPDTSEVRKDIIRFALQSVGKVPYYWGGKPSARNYSGNNFGSVTIPDHRGRILRGLDCSGWINWVYWSVTGKRLPYEGTDGLRRLGRQVERKDLKPGDYIVITGSTPHVVMFLGWAPNGQIQCIHETGSSNNVTVGVMTANWPYYRNILD